MKIALFDVNEADRAFFQEALVDHECLFFPGRLSGKVPESACDTDILSVFVGSEVRKEVIDAMPNLKLIVARSTGFDHIDIAYAKKKGIAVSTVPAYGSHTVAEYTFALFLALSRKVVAANRDFREHDDVSLADLEGFDLFGKTIGIIGLGKIGANVARIAKGFGMRVLAPDTHVDTGLAAELGISFVPFDQLLLESDVVSLHVPYLKETHHLMNAAAFAQMKKGAYLINTARGEIVDTDALIAALENGTLGGAGLDVLEGERYLHAENTLLSNGREEPMETKEGFRTLLESHALIRNPRVVATPHIAFYSREAVHEIRRASADSILGFLAGAPKNLL